MDSTPPVSALVLAGGRGTRIATLYPDLPKPLIPAAGAPFLEWLTRWLVAQGVRHLVLSTGYRAEQIHRWAATTAQTSGLRLDCRSEQTPLGTGGAVRHCLDLCGPIVLVLNGDSLTLTDLDEAFSRLESENLDGVMVGIRVPDTRRYGSLDVDDQGMLRGFREKQPGAGLISCGIYLFRQELLATIPEGQALSIEAEFIPPALTRGARIGIVHAARSKGPPAFIDIGTPETVHQAGAFISNNQDAFPPLPKL